MCECIVYPIMIYVLIIAIIISPSNLDTWRQKGHNANAINFYISRSAKNYIFYVKILKRNLCFLIELLNILRNIDLLSGLSFFPPITCSLHQKGNVFSLVVWSCLHLKQSPTILLASLFALNHCTWRSLTFVSTIYGEE